MSMLPLREYVADLESPAFPVCGRLVRSVGLLLEASGPPMTVGNLVRVNDVAAQAVGFRDGELLLLALDEARGLRPGAAVRPFHLTFRIGHWILGRVLDGLGRPMDGKPLPAEGDETDLDLPPPDLNSRRPVEKPFDSGVRAINGIFTMGIGQKIGIFSMPGAGKSTLLAMMARTSAADATVIALIGERGREAREFIDELLGAAGLERSVVVVVTGDQPAPMRLRGAFLATAIAAWLRRQGRNVLLLMDSLTRVAMAQREIGLASGEPPTMRGYPPSVYALAPRLVEQAGQFDCGSITGIYTVLLHEEEQDVVGEIAKGTLDGHIALTARLARRGHYPAIEVLESVSRVVNRVSTSDHSQARGRFVELYSRWRDAEELIALGQYSPGADARTDEAVALHQNLEDFLRQDLTEGVALAQAVSELRKAVGWNEKV
ncbi:MAG: FliI/YscN family ATPase [Candidatus Binataceae bacterium]